MGFFSSLGSALSSGFSAVCSAVSSIGSSVGRFCADTLPRILPIIAEKIVPYAAMASTFLQVLGVFNSNEKVEDIGDRSLQAAERDIQPDNFASHAEYMQSLRDFPLDPQKTEAYPMETKVAAGLAVGTVGLEKKFELSPGALAPLWVLPALNPQFFTPERMTAMLNTSKDIGSIVNYFDSAVSPATARNVEAVMVATEQKLSPQKEVADIYRELNAAKQEFQAKAAQADT